MAIIKKWEADMAGVLATFSDMEKTSYGYKPIRVNQRGGLQYYLKIISDEPSSFPKSVKVVTCYGEELIQWGFVDNEANSDDERISLLEEFLHSYILFFKVELNRTTGHTTGTNDFYVAKNIHIQKKADSYTEGVHLNPIPIYNETISNMKQADFDKALLKQGYLGTNSHVSKEKDDYTEYIAWGEENNQKLTIYGFFSDFSHAHGGFKYIPEEKVRWLKLNKEILNDSYVSRDILFMPWETVTDIEEEWEQAELLEPTFEDEALVNLVLEKEIKKPSSKLEEENVNEVTLTNEEKFMNRFVQYTKKNGLVYDEKDLYNFHTAVKTGSLVILSGMSGTGKSKLVQEYALALHIDTENELFVPVRPFWQDDADVIGYLDTLNNIYRPGDSGLVNLLIRAQNDTDSIFVVCFDEMNLARVEHYFSQFLSVLEMEEGKRVLKLYNEEYENRIHNSHAYPPKVKIGKNVIFVGTVNVDESTHHFSDKVLDRANVINLAMSPFNELLQLKESRKRKEDKTQPSAQIKNLAVYYNEFETFINRKEDETDFNEEEMKFFWELHELLSKYNKNIGVGWRIVKQIEKYVKNVPKFGPFGKSEAIDIQLVQRVMTKIRGSEEQLQSVLGAFDSEEDKVLESKLEALFDKYLHISEFTRAREVLASKSRELQMHGHTI
jgi:energy-coupling factor transporter ATP-binding protein EcfA2